MRLIAWLLAISAFAVLAFTALWVWRFTVDDTYITLRYSRHLAQGFGPNFNLTGPPAEGYTSFIWMIVLTGPYLLEIPALGVAKALGVIATVGTTAVVAGWVRDSTRDARVMPIAVAAAVASYAMLGRTAVHAVSGMETAFYTLLLTTLFYAAVRAIQSPARARYWQLALLAAIVGLSRPEGNLAAGVLMLGAAIALPARDRAPFMRVIVLGWALPLVAYQVARFSYYGLFFPLPFYVKVSAPTVFPGLSPVLDWLGDVTLRLGLPAGAAVATSSRGLRPVSIAALAIVAFMLLPEHLNGYDFRYLAPLDPLLSVLFGIGVARVLQWMQTSPLQVPALIGLVALACGPAVVDAPRSLRRALRYADGMAAAHEPLGRDLAALGINGRVALSDAGAIPYLSDWWTLDLVGLNDAEIAVTHDRSPDRVLASDPHVIVLVSGSGDRFEPVDWNAWEGPLYETALERSFACVSIRRFDVDYWLWVLARPESTEGRALRGAAFSLPCPSSTTDVARSPDRERDASG